MGPKTAWFPTFLKIPYFFVVSQKKECEDITAEMCFFGWFYRNAAQFEFS